MSLEALSGFALADVFAGALDFALELGVGHVFHESPGCHVYGPWIHFGTGVGVRVSENLLVAGRVWSLRSMGTSCDGTASLPVEALTAGVIEIAYRVPGY